jgi:DNA-3-methyladenine glycosylase I
MMTVGCHSGVAASRTSRERRPPPPGALSGAAASIVVPDRNRPPAGAQHVPDLLVGPDGRPRCRWAGSAPEYLDYHDREWGRPVHDEARLFEKLCLEGFQTGLSWLTILRKRAAFRRAFAGFDPAAVAAFGDADVERLMHETIIRNRQKILSTIANARAIRQIQGEHGSFDAFVWSFVGGKPLVNEFRTLAELPAQTAESAALSKALRKRGFGFVGPTICYAFMQAAGLVNDHVVSCPYRRVAKEHR